MQILRLFFEGGSDIAARDVNGATALHLAAGHGRVFIVGVLLEKGPDIDGRVINGGTALQYAIPSKDVVPSSEVVPVAKFLLKKGANISILNNRGMGALRLAIFHGHCGLVELLLLNGGNINAWGNDGTSVLH